MPLTRTKPSDHQDQGHAVTTQTEETLEAEASSSLTQVKVPPPTEDKGPTALRTKVLPQPEGAIPRPLPGYIRAWHPADGEAPLLPRSSPAAAIKVKGPAAFRVKI